MQIIGGIRRLLHLDGIEEERAEDSEPVKRAIRTAFAYQPEAPNQLLAVKAFCARMWGSALASATLETSPTVRRLLSPSCLFLIGQRLCIDGEALFAIDTTPEILLIPASGAPDITGSHRPKTWRYRLDLDAPSGGKTRSFQQDAVIHFKVNEDAAAPWRGISPFDLAKKTSSLASNIESAINTEASQALITYRDNPNWSDYGHKEQTQNIASWQESLINLEARNPNSTGIVELDAGRAMKDEQTRPLDDAFYRTGPDIEQMRHIRPEIVANLAAAAGVPPSLMSATSQGVESRESWRQFIYGTIVSLSRIVGEEIERKLGYPVGFDFADILASDIGARSAAYQKLIDGGMTPDRAALICGLRTEGTKE